MIHFWLSHALSAASVVLTLVFVASILRTRRAAGSTIAWLIVIVAAPYVGIPLYLFLSTRKLRPAPAPTIAADDALTDIQKLFCKLGAPPPRTNSKIELLTSGESAYRDLLAAIQNARRSIFITTFIFGNDDVGVAITSALVEKAETGVEIRLLVDSLGAAAIGHPCFDKLKGSRAKVAYFMPVLHIPLRGRTNLRNHRKLMVIDSEIAFVGGMNLAEEYMGPRKSKSRWVDLAVRIEGGCVADIENLFRADWLYATNDDLSPPGLPPAPTGPPSAASAGTQTNAQLIASGPDVASDPLYDLLLTSIYRARRSIAVVTPYFIPDESLAKALELAAKRGLSVRVIIPKRSNHRLADLARGSFVRQLTEAGVEFGYFPRMIHAKAVLFDNDLGLVGSANFDMRSLLLNYELGLALYSNESLAALASWMEARFQETTRPQLSTSASLQIAEGLGRVLGPLL